MFKKIIIAIIAVHAALLAYFLIFLQYFQQDEWHGFGIMLSQGIRYITLDKSIPELLLGDRVGARVLAFSLFNTFHLNPVPYGIFSFIMQTSNVFLVFLLAKRLTKHLNIALFSALLFMINEVGSEAYSWFGTMTGTLTSAFFFLLSLIFFLKFIDSKKYRFILLSTFLLWFSFLFKEVGVFAFIFYPILFLIYSTEKVRFKTLFKSLLSLIALGGIMLVFFAKTVLFIPGDQANYVEANRSFMSTLIFHSIQYPLEGIVQTLIPNSFLFTLSPITTGLIGFNIPVDSMDFLVASQGEYAELTTIILLIILTTTTTFILRKKWNIIPIASKKALKISIVIVVLSFIPYVVLNRSFAYLDSRHYYMAAIGSSIFLATFMFIFFNLSKSKKIKIAIIAIGAGYILMHEIVLFEDFKLFSQRAYERRLFLRQTEQLIPKLSKKTIFYVTGDFVGYYGLPELKVPFQSGLGHVLMVIYAAKKQLSPKFFDEETKNKIYDVGFLYDILGQGYREINGQGFGYYYDKLELEKALSQNLFDKKDVISLYYKQEKMRLIRLDSIK